MKVLLVANDLMPFGSLPTSGGGLRCYQLMKGLEAHGVEVHASMPGFTYLAEKYSAAIPEPQRELLWRWGTQDDILRRVKPDAVLFASNWDHYNLADPPDVPLVIDLHGSRLIETTMFGNPVSTERKVEVLGRADCLLSAGRRQRSYFYGWLAQAGRAPQAEHFIRYVPVSLGPDLPEHTYPGASDPDAPRIVSGGGWFPWQNQARAVFAACREAARRDRGTVAIYGTPHENPTLSREERAIRAIYAEVVKLAERSPRIQVRGYVGRDRLLAIYGRASVAIEAMLYNLERELAFTTRTIEYLWCGLPVLYNDYGEVAEHIREYDAGWTIDPDDDRPIAAALEEVFEDQAAVRRKGQNAQRLVRDRFTWDRTIEPLLDFLRHPRRASPVEPVPAPPLPPPAYLVPRGESVEVPLVAPSTRIEQPFVVPAEHLGRVSLTHRFRDEALPHLSRATLRVRDTDGRLRVRRTYRPDELGGDARLEVAIPWYRRPRAGEQLVIEVEVQSRLPGSAPLGSLGGLARPRFPILPREGGPPLALHLTLLVTRPDRVLNLARRVGSILRAGGVRRLVRLAAHRAPSLARRVRRLVGGVA
jgi:glycosyltransferase involved in cell wall biosynthesis